MIQNREPYESNNGRFCYRPKCRKYMKKIILTFSVSDMNLLSLNT